MNEQESPMKITTLGELQWWSLEVISGTIMAVGVGIFAGRQSLGLVVTFLVAAGVLLSVFLIGALLRRVGHRRSTIIAAPPEQVFDAVLTLVGHGAFLRSLWGIALTVERPAKAITPDTTLEGTYSVGTDPLSVSSSRKGELTLTVDDVDPPRKLVQHAINKFRGRRTRSVGVITLEPHEGGTKVTERTRLILPMNASHFIGAVYSRMVLRHASSNFLKELKQEVERGG